MRILVAMDSFKGNLDSIAAAEAVREGILSVDPNADVSHCPLADGGEGTMDTLICHGRKNYKVAVWATGPHGEPVRCHYGVLENGTAVIEIAEAAGLTLIPEKRRRPTITTTFGVGEMIRDAIKRGCREFIIGLGGSGTNDGGAGMLEALGWSFLDEDGERIGRGAFGLKDLVRIDGENVMPELSQCRFRVACDVTNPLLGYNGCSAVFGPQKGADEKDVKDMDSWLASYSEKVRERFPTADPYAPGTGAAGGLGFAFSVFLGGVLESGADIIGQFLGIEEKIRSSDLIITGEGSFDGQSAMGKGPMYIARLGKKCGKPVIVLAGAIGNGADKCLSEGVLAYFPILQHPMSLQEAMDPQNAYSNLKHTAAQVFRLYNRS